MENLGSYYLGALIVDHQALDRINVFRKTLLGYSQKLEEAHLTILPPFRAAYEDASAINVGCGCSSIKSDHPMHTTYFEMHGMDILGFGEEEFIVCPILPHVPPGAETWQEYVLSRRQRLKDLGIEYKEPIPDEYRPHVTVCRRNDISIRLPLERLITESRKEPPLFFRVSYLVLQAKYREGYSPLSSDPARE